MNPIVAAPMAGGPSTPALVAAVADAGGFGYLAAGYLTADALAAQLAQLRQRSDRPFGVNLFLPDRSAPAPYRRARLLRRERAVEAYARRIAGEAHALHVELGDPYPSSEPDAGPGLDAKLRVLAAHPPDTISVTFALPDDACLAALRATGARLVATVTGVEEARAATAAGFDGLVVQGTDAGGHRGTHTVAAEPNDLDTLDLLRAIRPVTALPLVAAGGVADAAGVRRALDAGAERVQLGTAFLRTDEAGTSTTHRDALADPEFSGTTVTRAFTGRAARALTNRFAVEHGPAAPAAYPELHHLTRPVRAAAARAGDVTRLHLWAGVHFRRATTGPAADVVQGLLR
ncbi:nitronate monooxygenase [Actinomycetospora chiangmaiensis]|uniref:nitronate monooxygenase n=1 Tax=Actinomycetospora chiangmaiensis TaxID=402650 RepID=UPI00036E475D|nr:nitronate monooxygenase [Actinomycetospora chiangmaiensis]